MQTVWRVLATLAVVTLLLGGLSIGDRQLSVVGAAWAQDDDDDGDDNDDDGGGGGGSSDADDDDGGGGSSGGGSAGGGGSGGGGSSGGGGPSAGGGEGGGLFAPLRRFVAPAPVAPPTPRRAPAPQPLPVAARDEIVATGLDAGALAVLVGRGYRVIEERPGADRPAYRLAVPPGLPLDAARDEVRAQPGATADLNHFYRAEQGTADTACAVSPCPARTTIDWPDIPARTGVCGQGVPLGMIDTGINEGHDTFRGAAIEVVRLTGAALDQATAVHGTAVAALFVGDPASRSPGLVPGARLFAVDAFHRSGTDERADAFTLVAALDHLAAAGVRVINLSLAGPPNAVLEQKVRDLAQSRDILLVAAAGNSGPAAAPQYPAAYPDVLAVTAVDRRGEPWRRAARGPHVEIAAPGVDVWTAASIRGARTKTGTSFAAPFVSAAGALLRDRHPEMTAAEVRKRLVASAADLGPPGPDETFGAGLLTPLGLCD